ncbi:hypothetical protein ABWK43_09790 [Bacillus thuringiensis]|uniref:hypothetical protein n=1 Tax=Bacillus thuringiensis TaxID=1428 RepID=UPI00339A2A83
MGYPKINMGIDNANEALKKSYNAESQSSSAVNIANSAGNAANSAVNKAESVQKQLDTIIIESGTSDAEVIQARGDKPVLNDRLNDMNTQVAEAARAQEQIDYVDNIANQMFVKSMYLTCNDKTTCGFSIGYELASNKGMMYYTAPQSNDNYSLVQGGRVGDLNTVYMTSDYKKYTSKNGNFNESFAPNCFATTIGDTMTLTFSGAEGLSFNHFKDNRGGRWKFTLSTDPFNPVYVSTYAATSQTTQASLFTDLDPTKSYTVVGEFVGDDPVNPPVGGTSRGWYCISTDNNMNTKDTFFLRKKTRSVVNYIEPLKSGSNKDFAFFLRRKGQTYPMQFFPWHSGVVTTLKKKDYDIYVDGILSNGIVTNAETINNISKVEIIQYVYCKLPDDPNNLGYLTSKYTFTKNGMVTINCSFKALEDLEIKTGYVNMIPVLSQFCKTLKTSLMTKYSTIATSGSTNLIPEKDNVNSYIWGNGDRQDIVIAMTNISLLSSMRKGKIDRRNILTWIEHRDATMQKFYPQVFDNATMQKDEVYSFGAKYIVGVAPNLSELYFL